MDIWLEHWARQQRQQQCLRQCSPNHGNKCAFTDSLIDFKYASTLISAQAFHVAIHRLAKY